MKELCDIVTHQKCDKEYPRWLAKAKTEATARRGDFFVMKDGIVRRLAFKLDEQGQHQAKIVVPTCLRAHVLRNYHGLPISAHQGRDRTMEIIGRRFYWKGMWRDVGR